MDPRSLNGRSRFKDLLDYSQVAHFIPPREYNPVQNFVPSNHLLITIIEKANGIMHSLLWLNGHRGVLPNVNICIH
jgi:hypothetical protein